MRSLRHGRVAGFDRRTRRVVAGTDVRSRVVIYTVFDASIALAQWQSTFELNLEDANAR